MLLKKLDAAALGPPGAARGLAADAEDSFAGVDNFEPIVDVEETFGAAEDFESSVDVADANGRLVVDAGVVEAEDFDCVVVVDFDDKAAISRLVVGPCNDDSNPRGLLRVDTPSPLAGFTSVSVFLGVTFKGY
jgi:hypothetical protein